MPVFSITSLLINLIYFRVILHYISPAKVIRHAGDIIRESGSERRYLLPQSYLINPYQQGNSMAKSSNYAPVKVIIYVDTGKDPCHTVIINRSDNYLFDKILANDENKLRKQISGLRKYGHILLIADQPATIVVLPVHIARSEGVLVRYL